MDIQRLSTYLRMDRRHALAVGRALPDRVEGTALFADIAGFTLPTEVLVTALGQRRGAEELTGAMVSFTALPTPGRMTASLTFRVGVATGPVLRLVVGAPQVQCLDVVSGAILDRRAQAEQLACQGDIVVGPSVVRYLGKHLSVAEWRGDSAVVADRAVHTAGEPAEEKG